MFTVTMILAADEKNGIAKDGRIPWDDTEVGKFDLMHFKRCTVGATVVMGRKTWETLPGPLPDRHNVVLTRDQNYKAKGAEVIHSAHDLWAIARHNVWIIGGAEIYKEYEACVPRIVWYITRIPGDWDCDTHYHPRDDAVIHDNDKFSVPGANVEMWWRDWAQTPRDGHHPQAERDVRQV